MPSTMTLGDSPRLLSARELSDITRYCWPSYRRITNRVGGDLQARFSFSAPHRVLEQWFEESLGRELVEWYAGNPVFRGYIHEMRWRIGEDILVRSFDNLFNSVAVTHSEISNATHTSEFAEDQNSIDIYGRKQTILTAPELMGKEAALIWAAQELALSSQPRTFLENVGLGGGGKSTLEVTVYGWVHTLDWVLYTVAVETETEQPLHTIIRDMLTDIFDTEDSGTPGIPHDYVTPGVLEETSVEVPIKVDQRPMWTRIREFERLEQRVLGCFGSRRLDFFDGDQYVLHRVSEGGRLALKRNNDIVDPANVLPYGYLFLQDVFPTRTYSSLSDSLYLYPGVCRIDSIEYSQQGVRFSTAPSRIGARKSHLSNARFAFTHYLSLTGGEKRQPLVPGVVDLPPPSREDQEEGSVPPPPGDGLT